VIVAHGETAVRHAVCDSLRNHGMVVVACAADGVEAIELATYYRPNVLLVVSADLPLRDGITVIRAVAQAAPAVRPVLCSPGPEPDLEMRALMAGAAGFATWHTMLRVIDAVARGETATSREVLRHMLQRLPAAPAGARGVRPVRSPLSAREWQVLDRLRTGCDSDEVALSLGMSVETVQSHLKNISRKLGVRGRDAVIATANELVGQALAS
jgi:DNA-binding NarL/FixJ family response regulator